MPSKDSKTKHVSFGSTTTYTIPPTTTQPPPPESSRDATSRHPTLSNQGTPNTQENRTSNNQQSTPSAPLPSVGLPRGLFPPAPPTYHLNSLPWPNNIRQNRDDNHPRLDGVDTLVANYAGNEAANAATRREHEAAPIEQAFLPAHMDRMEEHRRHVALVRALEETEALDEALDRRHGH